MALVALAQGSVTTTPQPQEHRIIQSCRGCKVQFVIRARLGSATDEVLLTRTPHVARLPDGRFVVSGTHTPGALAIYDQTGGFQRAIGRLGGGVGEFTDNRVQLLVGETSLYAVDGGYVTRYSLPTLAPVEKKSLSIVPSYVAISGGTLFINSIFPPDSSGVPLVIAQPLDSDSVRTTILRSEMADGRPDAWSQVRVLTGSRRGGVWTSPVNRREIRELGSEGEAVRDLNLPASWFTPWSGSVPGEPIRVRPRPRVVHLKEDSEGRLWVFTLVADASWKPASRAGEALITPDSDPGTIYDTIIEAVDLHTAEVLVVARSRRYIGVVDGADAIYFTTVDKSGIVSLNIADLVIARGRL